MTEIITRGVSEYAPKPRREPDPLTLGKITVEAVDQIGAKAASEIDRAAAQIREGADEVAGRLEQLAEAIRSHSKIASDHTAQFVARTTEVLETVRALDARLESQGANGKLPPKVVGSEKIEEGHAESKAAG
jgi:predicted transcriptional regulator